MTAPTAFPLTWPDGYPRAADRTPGPSRVSMASAVLQLKDALHLFGLDSGNHVRDVLISSNVTLDQARPKDPGVAVYFGWRGLRRCIACDLHGKPEENLREIYEKVEGWRKTIADSGDLPASMPALLTIEDA